MRVDKRELTVIFYYEQTNHHFIHAHLGRWKNFNGLQ